MDIMDNRVIMDIMDIMEFMDIAVMIITAWMAMAGAVFAMRHIFSKLFHSQDLTSFFSKKISTDSLCFYGQ